MFNEVFRCASISWFQVVSQPVINLFLQLAHLRVFQSYLYFNTGKIYAKRSSNPGINDDSDRLSFFMDGFYARILTFSKLILQFRGMLWRGRILMVVSYSIIRYFKRIVNFLKGNWNCPPMLLCFFWVLILREEGLRKLVHQPGYSSENNFLECTLKSSSFSKWLFQQHLSEALPFSKFD